MFIKPRVLEDKKYYSSKCNIPNWDRNNNQSYFLGTA